MIASKNLIWLLEFNSIKIEKTEGEHQLANPHNLHLNPSQIPINLKNQLHPVQAPLLPFLVNHQQNKLPLKSFLLETLRLENLASLKGIARRNSSSVTFKLLESIME
jgi:hypothetical protein